MSTVLVIDRSALSRDIIVKAIEENGHTAIGVAGMTDAVNAFRHHSLNMVIVDPSVAPNRYGVLKIIAHCAVPARVPILVISDPLSHDEIVNVALLGIRDYLLKTEVTIERILERVSRRLASGAQHQNDAITTVAPANMNEQPERATERIVPPPDVSKCAPITTRDEVLDLIRRGLELRPLAPVVQNVISLTQSAQCSVDDIARCLGQDQALSIRILRLANGSAYSRGRTVDTLKEAVARIGIRELRNVATALSVVQQYEGRLSACIDPRLFWEHSIACGLIASAVARACNLKNAEDYFMWGMLHDLGRIVLVEHLGEKYAGICEEADRVGAPLEAMESRVLTVDHSRVLETVLKHWQFPTEFITPIAHHHAPLATLHRLGAESAKQATIVAFADRLAHSLLLGDSGNHVLYALEEHARALGLAPDAIDGIIASIAADTNAIKFGMLAQANQLDWPDARTLHHQSFKTPVRPLFAEGASSLDPLRLFFERVSDTSSELPPNLGVLYVAHHRALSESVERLKAAETSAGVEPLPTILVFGEKRVEVDRGAPDRRCTSLFMPIHINKLIEECDVLLQPNEVEVQRLDKIPLRA